MTKDPLVKDGYQVLGVSDIVKFDDVQAIQGVP